MEVKLKKKHNKDLVFERRQLKDKLICLKDTIKIIPRNHEREFFYYVAEIKAVEKRLKEIDEQLKDRAG